MADAEAGLIYRITVVWSPAARQLEEVLLELTASVTVAQALRASGLLQRYPQLDASDVLLGCWGRRVGLNDDLAPDSRLEIYRPLTVDPKEARRLRYRAQGERSRIHRRPQERGSNRTAAAVAPTDAAEHPAE